MGIGETARLISSLELQDKFSGPASAVGKSLGGLEQKSNFVQKGFGLISQAASGVGGAVSHLKGRIGQLISGPLGMIGLGAGLFSIGKLFTDGISQAQDFGKVVGRLAALTGLSTEATSRLAGAFRHFGIESDTVLAIAGMVEKNLFRLGGTVKAAEKFQDKYGLALVDSSGRLKDFNTLLLDTSDFFNNKSIPAATKAAALAAIYGKSWQNLIPILGAGRKAISDAEQQAQELGLTLTKDNLAALGKLKAATRDWNDALGGLKLQLGLAVIPLLTDLTKGAFNFLRSADEFGVTGTQKIIGFFKGVIEFGKKAFGIIETQVVPIVQKVIKGWDDLPDPLKGLLVKGVSGNFAIKFLLGFDPVGIALSAGGAVAGKLAGAAAGALAGFVGDFFGRTAANKLIPQVVSAVAPIPVFVTNAGFGLPGSNPLAPTAAARGKFGFLGDLLKVTVIGAVAVAGTKAALDLVGINAPQHVGEGGQIFRGTNVVTDQILHLENAAKQLRERAEGGDTFAAKQLSAIEKQLAELKDINSNTHPLKETGSRTPKPILGPPKPIKLDDAALIAALEKTSEFGKAGVGTTIEHGIKTGTDPFGEQALALFRQAEFPQQGRTLGEIQRHIIAAEEVQKTYLQEGDINSARRTQAVIDGLHALLGSTDQTRVLANSQLQETAKGRGILDRIAGKDFSPNVNVNVNATTNLTVSGVSRVLTSYRNAISTKLVDAGIY